MSTEPIMRPERALGDIVKALSAAGLNLSDAATSALTVLFYTTAGKFMFNYGNVYPERDLWKDPKLVFFRDYILDEVVVDIVSALKKQADNGMVGHDLLIQVSYEVMHRPKTTARCDDVVERLKGVSERAFITPICDAKDFPPIE